VFTTCTIGRVFTSACDYDDDDDVTARCSSRSNVQCLGNSRHDAVVEAGECLPFVIHIE